MLHGLLRVRAFTQDDAHVFCTEDQIVAEVRDITESIDELYALFGFDDVRVELSTRPEKSIGTDEQWETAERALAQALEEMGREYKLNPGDGAFYGPKIDFHITDALGRSWQCGTCQARLLHAGALRPHLHGAGRHAAHAGDDPPRAARLDRALPRHPDRALRGRVPGLARARCRRACCRSPTATRDYAGRVAERAARARACAPTSTRARSRSGGRSATPSWRRFPYMLVVGDNEQEQAGVSLRRHREGDLGLMPLGEVADRIAR